jgi:hypothetical protein
METILSSETPVHMQTTLPYIPEGGNVQEYLAGEGIKEDITGWTIR